NALLVPAYLEAFQATGDPAYARVVRETLDYVLREMTQPAGGFYSTQDADSEGEEGKFFVWTETEIENLLGPADARIFNYCYDVSAGGNWEGHSILNRPKTDAQAAKVLAVDETDLAAVLSRGRQKLFDVRAQRIAPGRDDKALVSWNGMMISALAGAAQVLGEDRYARAASDAADFLLNRLGTPDGKLLHSYKDGQARFNGYLDDYACLIDGLVDVYQATFEPRYLTEALSLADTMIALFHDKQEKGFFYTSSDHEALIARNKEAHDGSTPSGNSMAAWALLRLGRICGRSDLEEIAESTLEFLSSVLAQSPTAAAQALLALDFLLGPTREVAIVDGTNAEESSDVLNAVHRRFLPNKLIVRKTAAMTDETLPVALKPLLQGKVARGGSATIYICDHGTCGLPVVGVQGLEAALS
ncbi:MAG TPA: hypothetical protein VGH74_12760, partial [Planctomycetaceae bacterium]